MKSLFVSELRSGASLEDEAFLFQDVIQRSTKDGRDYLLGMLRDKSGQVSFVFWDVPDYALKWVKPGQILLVTGRTNNYKESLQVNITDVNEYLNPDMAAFLPSSKRSREEMIAELKDIVTLLDDPWQRLVTLVLLQDEDFLRLFANAPAGRKMHHAYIGGLIEHSLSMANLAHQLADHYPDVDRDLLVSGALLHDLGKAIEYNVADGFSFTEDGRLVGHIVRAVVVVEQSAQQLEDFPEDKLRDVVHLIVSHHGTNEWGAPVTPKTLEAVLLHQIDLIDSRVHGYLEFVENDAGEGPWTLKNSPMFGTDIRYPINYQKNETPPPDHSAGGKTS